MDDPIALFQRGLDEAKKTDLHEPTAMTLATVAPSGEPEARMVLLKDVDERGLVFYTNLESPKAIALERKPTAAHCFYWMPLKRQVCIHGTVERVSDEEADAYFASRPRLSQISAWASPQSQPMEGYFELEKVVAKTTLKFGLGKIPRPDFWSGYRVVPDMIEFWREKPFRRHERFQYTRDGDAWKKIWLFP